MSTKFKLQHPHHSHWFYFERDRDRDRDRESCWASLQGKKTKMMMAKKNDSSHWWWFDSHSKGSPNRSPWLQTTLSELDEKTRRMLQVIEEDADSFAQRAEMYYRKRPELISMVEDFYRTHRSLAERYDLVKTESGSRLPSSPWSSLSLSSSSSSPLPFTKYHLEKSPSLCEGAYDSYSEACGPDDESDESEVDDPEEEVVGSDMSSEGRDGELVRLREEVARLLEENERQREELKAKDEEKREVIRQLSRGMEMLREENVMLRECLSNKTPKKDSRIEYTKMKENFFGRLFNGFGKPPVIAL